MAYNKAEKSDSPVRRKGGIRRRKEEKSFPEESQETVQSISVH